MKHSKAIKKVLFFLIPGIFWYPALPCLAQPATVPPQDVLPPRPTPPVETPSPLPPLEDLLKTPIPEKPEVPSETLPDTTEQITIDKFVVQGNTVFSAEELEKITAPYTGKPIPFTSLTKLSSEITQLYYDAGYITSGAFIPSDQTFDDRIVTIQVLEGELEAIDITGLRRLNPGYVRGRLELAAGKPLNVNRLIEGLQLLELDPLIESISAELGAGSGLGLSILKVDLKQANTFSSQLRTDNGRSPSVGSIRGVVQLQEANLLGLGDGLSAAYSRTEGSDEIDTDYILPVNSLNGTLQFRFRSSWNDVIEEQFNKLDIQSESLLYQFSFRQPVIRSPRQELALGVSFDRQESKAIFLDTEPIGLGADANGQIRVSALRFFQEWTQRNQNQVFALRSQLSFGLDWFNATRNEGEIPDSQFFSWLGQAQWVRQLAPDTLVLLSINGQVADRTLLSQEQFGIGGFGSVRGYRQDQILTDTGLFTTLEFRVPIIRIPEWDSIIQIAPFFDYGIGWNVNVGLDPNPTPNDIASVGLGLIWDISDRFSARLDYGIPLIEVQKSGNSLQEDGFLFSIVARPF
jgi:hemolysin activation/secretion protein